MKFLKDSRFHEKMNTFRSLEQLKNIRRFLEEINDLKIFFIGRIYYLMCFYETPIS